MSQRQSRGHGIRRVAALRALWDAFRGTIRPGSPGLAMRLRAIPRMLAMSWSGRYPHLSRSRLLMVAIGLVYLMSPVDVLPELLLPVIGFGDDALVAAWLASVLLGETETFLVWERDRGEVLIGEVVTPGSR